MPNREMDDISSLLETKRAYPYVKWQCLKREAVLTISYDI